MKIEIPLLTLVLGEFLDQFVTASIVEWSRQEPDWISGRWQLELMRTYQQLSRQALPWMARRKINSWSWKRVRFRERQAFFICWWKTHYVKKKKKVQMQGIEKIIIKGSWEEEVEWNQSRVDINWKDVYFLYWRKLLLKKMSEKMVANANVFLIFIGL